MEAATFSTARMATSESALRVALDDRALGRWGRVRVRIGLGRVGAVCACVVVRVWTIGKTPTRMKINLVPQAPSHSTC